MTNLARLLEDPTAIDALSPDEAASVLAQLGAHQAQLGGLGMRLAARLAGERVAVRTGSPDRLLTLPEVAERLSFTEQYVRGLVQGGQLAAVRPLQEDGSPGKYVRVRESAVAAWVRDHEEGGDRGGLQPGRSAQGGGGARRRRRLS